MIRRQTREAVMGPERLARRRGGFTLIDVLTTIAVIVIVVAMALPSMAPDNRSRAVGGAQMLASDIEYAQSISLATPSDLAMVRFGADGRSYWIAHESAPDTPITTPYSGEPYMVRFGEGRAALLYDVAFTLDGVTDSRLTFDEYARPETLANAAVTLTNAGGSVRVCVASSTGTVTIP